MAVAIGLVLWLHATVLAPFALSLVVAYAMRPAVEGLVRRGVSRSIAAAGWLLILIGIVSTVLILLVPIVSTLVPKLKQQLPDLAVAVWQSVTPVLTQWGVKLPTTGEAIKADLIQLVQTYFPQLSGALLHSVLIGGSGLLTAMGFLLVVPVLTFYILLDWDALASKWLNLLPPRWLPPTMSVLRECDVVMGQFLRGQFLVMVILAVYYSVALTLFRFELALPIGVFTGLAIFVPYLGYGLGLVLAVLAGLLQFAQAEQGLIYPVIAISIVYGAGQFIESFFLTPRLVGERIGLHPAGVILALLLFGQWAGLVGVFVALPVSAVSMIVIRHGLAHYRASALYQG